MHTPYHIKLGHPSDFRVRYRFYTMQEGGRPSPPHQAYRSDFWYNYPGHRIDHLFVIWPEFENADGDVILESGCSVPFNGTARMWIITPELRAYHYDKIKCGLIGYFMEGQRKMAECEVIELIGLLDNPVK